MSVEVVKRHDSESGSEQEVDVHFEPVVVLPEVEVSTNEEDEEVMIKLRAKLFRYDKSDPNAPEWKERGTGEVKMLRHKDNNSVRIVMRRDRTLKICANHFITPWTALTPSAGSNRAWVWNVPADFADETAKPEFLAIRFASAELAMQWKNKFDEAKHVLMTKCKLYMNSPSESESESESESDLDSSKENKEAIDGTVINNLSEMNISK